MRADHSVKNPSTRCAVLLREDEDHDLEYAGRDHHIKQVEFRDGPLTIVWRTLNLARSP